MNELKVSTWIYDFNHYGPDAWKGRLTRSITECTADILEEIEGSKADVEAWASKMEYKIAKGLID